MVLDSIPQKELPSLADVRKCMGVVKQIHGVIKTAVDEYNKITDETLKLQPEVDKASKPFRDKIEELKKGLTDEEIQKDIEIQNLVREANVVIRAITKKADDKRVKLDEKYAKDEVEIDLNPEYKTFIKANFETKIRPAYNFAADVVELADAFEIE